MYSTVITPKHIPDKSPGIKSDGQLRQISTPPATHKPTPRPTGPKLPAGISSQQILIGVIIYLLLSSEKPDWMLLAALVYILL